MMTEEFLHYIWKNRMLDNDLQTGSTEPLTIIHPGNHNHDGGPDFIDARIRIDNTLWAGNVEIHVNSSDWYRHRHQENNAYDNVILHVVYQDDLPVTGHFTGTIPTLVVNGHYPAYIFDRYRDFRDNRSGIPCQKLIGSIPQFHFEQWSASLAIERILQKTVFLDEFMECSKNDWEETFYLSLSRAFGVKINSLAFELLARSLPLKCITRHNQNLFQLEALLFGQSGMLTENFSEEYPDLLKNEYCHLRRKYSLQPVNPGIWKFLRLRPSNFPTLRIAQFAALLYDTSDIFSGVIKSSSVVNLRSKLTVRASAYWDTHFVFGKLSTYKPKITGSAFINLVILNHVIPFLFYYGDEKGIQSCKDMGLSMLQELPGEKNAGITSWRNLGLPVNSALFTQALIQLKANYCDKKRCLECRIGNRLLMKNEE